MDDFLQNMLDILWMNLGSLWFGGDIGYETYRPIYLVSAFIALRIGIKFFKDLKRW